MSCSCYRPPLVQSRHPRALGPFSFVHREEVLDSR